MADNPILDLTDPSIAPYVYVKSNIGGWFFDAIVKANHETKLEITSHPVQTGANITDHAYMQPRSLTMEIAMSDTAESFIDGQFSGGWSRSVKAYDVLRQLQVLRIPLQVLTRLGLYDNMLIETISAPDDYTTLSGLKCTVTLKELLVATVQQVKISSRPDVTDNANLGNVPSNSGGGDQSTLKRIFDKAKELQTGAVSV